MSNTISLTLPRNDEEALVAGATLLLTLAGKAPAMDLPEMRDPCVRCDSSTQAPVETQLGAPAFDGASAFEAAQSTDEEIPPPPPLRHSAAADIADHTHAGTTDEDESSANPDLDIDGLPWDARIHAGTKTQTQDGRWKKKRGIDQEDYDRVVEELRQLMAVPVVAKDVPPPLPPVEQPITDEVPLPPPMEKQPVAGNDAPITFTEFLKAVSHKIQNKELTMEDVNGALPEGVANLQLLNGRQDLIPQVWAKLTGGEGDE